MKLPETPMWSERLTFHWNPGAQGDVRAHRPPRRADSKESFEAYFDFLEAFTPRRKKLLETRIYDKPFTLEE